MYPFIDLTLLSMIRYKMKKTSWVLYLFESDEKKELCKIMEFKTIKSCAFTLNIDPVVVSNWFHGLINARGILKNCSLYHSVPPL